MFVSNKSTDECYKTNKHSNVATFVRALINFSATVVSFHNYFVLATPYGAELSITINSSQLVESLPFLLNIQVKQ